MWEIVRAGGPLMWPIILCSITAAAIILERLWTLQDKRVLPRELPQKVWQLIESNQVNDKVIAALEQNSPLGRLLATGLANRHRPREILMDRLEDTWRHVVHELERFINTLGTIAGISPLLGLLGTVTGIIRAPSRAASPRRSSAPLPACASPSRRSSSTATCAAGSTASWWRWRNRPSGWRMRSKPHRRAAASGRRPRRCLSSRCAPRPSGESEAAPPRRA